MLGISTPFGGCFGHFTKSYGMSRKFRENYCCVSWPKVNCLLLVAYLEMWTADFVITVFYYASEVF